MTDQLHIVVPGQPVGKGRPRFARGRTYTPAKTKVYEQLIAMTAQREIESVGWVKTSAPVKMHILAQFEIPKSWTKKKQQAALRGEITPGRPDIDNVAKAALDALNGIAYDDDDQVYQLSVKKVYGQPLLVITIELG
jgi:Holliday junction resolvase RusA-like endonuclease